MKRSFKMVPFQSGHSFIFRLGNTVDGSEILHHLGCRKPIVNNGMNYQPQVVCRIIFFHQQYYGRSILYYHNNNDDSNSNINHNIDNKRYYNNKHNNKW